MKTVHFVAPYLINPTHEITVALVGAGGTGQLPHSFILMGIAFKG